jgi:hypothetical protein
LVTNQQEEPNFKPLVDQNQTMLHILPFTRLIGGPMDYPGIFEMDIKNLVLTIILMLTAPLLTNWLYVTMYSLTNGSRFN